LSGPEYFCSSVEFRVPVANASLVVIVKSSTHFGAITIAMREVEEGPPLKGILFVPDNALVSTNLHERTESAVFDPGVA
jgi:glyceraldehyde-3-phosphate dehydrogenase/erythrose-4-phosphate dehydrogenase